MLKDTHVLHEWKCLNVYILQTHTVAVTGAPGPLIPTCCTLVYPTCSETANATTHVIIYAIVVSALDAFYVSLVKAVFANISASESRL